MSEDETSNPNTPVGSPEMLLLIPCGGVERLMGQLTARTAIACAIQKTIPNLQLEPSFPQVITNKQRFGPVMQQAKIIALDGCGQKCVSKLLHDLGVKPFGSFPMPQLLKANKLQPPSGSYLSPEDEKLVPTIAQYLIKQIQALLKPKEEESERYLISFKPTYEKWLEYRQSKFIFKVPIKQEDFYFNWNDAWAYKQDGLFFIGISDYLQQHIGDVTVVELPRIGGYVEQLESLGSIETVKTVIDLIAPLSGKVVGVNTALLDAPEKINRSPYEEGWICMIEPADLSGERENLMSSTDYFDFMKGKVNEEAKKQK